MLNSVGRREVRGRRVARRHRLDVNTLRSQGEYKKGREREREGEGGIEREREEMEKGKETGKTRGDKS